MERTNFKLIYEEDARRLIEQWNATHKPLADKGVDYLTKALDSLLHSDQIPYMADDFFSYHYKVMATFTNQLPNVVKDLKNSIHHNGYTLTDETYASLCDVVEQAKEWKKTFRKLKKEWEEELRFFKLKHGMFSTRVVDYDDTKR